MNSLFTVIGFTFLNKAKSKSFLITSIVILVLLSAALNVPYIITLFSNDEPKQVGVFNDGSAVVALLSAHLEQLEDKDFELVYYMPHQSASENEKLVSGEISSGNIDGFLEFKENPSGVFPAVVYKSDGPLGFANTSMLSNTLSLIKSEIALQDLNLSEQLKADLFAPVNIENVQVSSSGADSTGDRTEEQLILAYGLVYVLIILFFMGTMISGQLIATEITTEKSSRVMEILVTSVAPLKQMFGKIIGMFLLGITQILLFVIVFIVNAMLPHNQGLLADFNINLSEIDPVLFVYFIAFYLLGYFLYATIFAAIGSIVSRTEDLGQAIMPVTFLTLAVFYVGIFGINDPASTFMTIMSFVPFFTPITMFIRIGMADPAMWEIALSFIILLATILLMGWLSAKIYRTGVLMYGKRPSFKEIRRAMKAFKV